MAKRVLLESERWAVINALHTAIHDYKRDAQFWQDRVDREPNAKRLVQQLADQATLAGKLAAELEEAESIELTD